MRFLSRARRLARSTPAHRNRAIDALRAIAILLVILGHWLVAAPELLPDGSLRAGHLLVDVPWTRVLTWVFQVMPVFFLVGGYANAVSLRAARRDGTGHGDWLRTRLRRLLLPVAPLLAVWSLGAWILLRGGYDAGLVRVGSMAALVPVWFLAAYVLAVVAAPLTLRLWERTGWIAFWSMAAVAVALDAVDLGFGVAAPAWANYLFVWNAVHLLGYAWLDGAVDARRTGPWLMSFGTLAAAALVALGPYPLSMVGVDGAPISNTTPPRITLVALGVAQFGVALLVEAPLRRVLDRVRPWTSVVAVNGAIMSIYLWHLTVMVAVVAMLRAVGWGLSLPAGGGAWWATRPLWLAALGCLLLPVAGAAARLEHPPPAPPTGGSGLRETLGAVLACAGLALVALDGIVDGGGVRFAPVALGLTGIALATSGRRASGARPTAGPRVS